MAVLYDTLMLLFKVL